jgi:hypothetical protein
MSKSNLARNLLAEGGDDLAQYYGWMANILEKIRDNKEITTAEMDTLKKELPGLRFDQSKVDTLLKSFSGGKRRRTARRRRAAKRRNTRKA